MDTVKVYGDEDLILKHFFKIIQTKTLLHPNEQKGKSKNVVVVTISSEEELIKVAKIIKQYVDGATEFQVIIFYCSQDHLFEFCKSKQSFDHIQLETKTLEYKFLTTFFDKDLVDGDDDGELTKTRFEIITAASYFYNQGKSNESIIEKIFSVKPSQQREFILQMMIFSNLHQSSIISGYIYFDLYRYNSSEKKCGDATIFDKWVNSFPSDCGGSSLLSLIPVTFLGLPR
jgi:hypothetical protein